MKKIALFFAFLFAAGIAFADKSRFYENGKIVDVMYVNSSDGLRIRNSPDLSGTKIGVLPYRLGVKVVALGKEETIDGITAPWGEILLPRYEWNNFEPEYGWIFGGYLEKTQRPFSTKGWTNADFKAFLSKCEWIVDSDEPHRRILVFEKDGSFKMLFEEVGAGAFGRWSADFSRRRVSTVASMQFAGDDDYQPPEKLKS